MTSPSRKTAVKTARTKYKHKEIIASNNPASQTKYGPSLKGNPDDLREDWERGWPQ